VYVGKEKEAVADMLPYLRLGYVSDPSEMQSVISSQGPICPLSQTALKLSSSTKALASPIPIILIHKLSLIHQSPHRRHRSSRTIADPIHHPPHPLRSPAHLCRSRRCLPQPIALVFCRSQGIELSNPQALPTSLAVEFKAPTSLRLEHFQRSSGPEAFYAAFLSSVCVH
ncbi:hypothetical protein CFP56_040296, partial [Quercus suber]